MAEYLFRARLSPEKISRTCSLRNRARRRPRELESVPEKSLAKILRDLRIPVDHFSRARRAVPLRVAHQRCRARHMDCFLSGFSASRDRREPKVDFPPEGLLDRQVRPAPANPTSFHPPRPPPPSSPPL